MKKVMMALAIVVLGLSAKAQSQSKPIVKEIDSLSISGLPLNRLVIRTITIGDSVVVVNGALLYQGRGANVSRGQLTFTEAIPITNSTNVSVNAVAALVANRRGVTIK